VSRTNDSHKKNGPESPKCSMHSDHSRMVGFHLLITKK
jgi:hypothetical protein